MNGASRIKQIKIYTGKCFRVFLNEKGWKIFISAAIITLLISSVHFCSVLNSQVSQSIPQIL